MGQAGGRRAGRQGPGRRLTTGRLAVTLILVLAARLPAQERPLDAFNGNIAAIHARDRAAYLSFYLQSPRLARVGPGGVALGYTEFVRSQSDTWPDTLVATHLEVVPITDDVAYGVYRYRVAAGGEGVGERGVSERVFVRTPAGWKIAITTAFPTPGVVPPPLALVGATLVDGTGTAPVPGAVVVLRDGRIACAGAPAACPVPADAHRIDARGKWVIPGLVDAHVHFSQTGWVDGRPDALDRRADHPYERVVAWLARDPARFFRSYLCSGVTSVFDVGGYPWTWDLQARTAASTTAPRVRAAGPLLSTIDFWLNLPGERQFVHLSDPETARSAVRAHAARGAAAIKIWYIVRAGSDTAQLSAAVRATGDEARAAGLPLIVHATGLWQAKDAIRARATLLVHSVDADPVDDEFLRLARAQGTAYTPTLLVSDGYSRVAARRFPRDRQPLGCVDPETRAKVLATDTVALDARPSDEQLRARRARDERRSRLMSANLRRIHDAGIPVVLGTDAGNPLTLHGASVFMELEAMQAAGLTPLEVLVAATRNGARALGLDSTGTVTAGSVADLVVLDADPTADIANVRQIALVVRRGEAYARGELEWP